MIWNLNESHNEGNEWDEWVDLCLKFKIRSFEAKNRVFKFI